MGLINMDEKQIATPTETTQVNTGQDTTLSFINSINESLKLLKSTATEFKGAIQEVGIMKGGEANVQRSNTNAQIHTQPIKKSEENNKTVERTEKTDTGDENMKMDVDKILKSINLFIKFKGDMKLSEVKEFMENNKQEIQELIEWI